MDWRTAWFSVTGSHPPFSYPPHWVGSLIFYAACYLFSTLLRKFNHSYIKTGHVQDSLADFIATFQTCAFSLENMHVLGHYGYTGLTLVLFLQILLFLLTYCNAQASPTGNFQKWWVGHLSHHDALVRISLQALAAYASYKFAQVVWSLDVLPDHKDKLHQFSCVTDLNVSLLTGFLIEAGATIIDAWMCMQVFMRSSEGDAAIKAVIDTAMVVLGLHLTGMYFNPAMASANTFGCAGINTLEHILVYWVGPFVGVIVALKINSKVKIE